MSDWKAAELYERSVPCKNPACGYYATESWKHGLVFGICTKCGERWDRSEDRPSGARLRASTGERSEESWDDMKRRHAAEAMRWQRSHGILTRDDQERWQRTALLHPQDGG